MANLPLSLALEPVLPSRVPTAEAIAQGFGFRLRLPDGLALEDDDPLLRAFAAALEWVEVDDDEQLQLEEFDPGRRLKISVDPFDGDALVLDADGVRVAGKLDDDAGAVARAAVEHGLELKALALWETRLLDDGRRRGLQILVYASDFVRIRARQYPYERPRHASRPRLVLFADTDGDLRWWDPAAAGGPVDVDDLPFSGDLADAFAGLRSEYGEMLSVPVEGGGELVEQKWGLEVLEERARGLWLRAQRELLGRYTVGYLGPGMARPIWRGPCEDDDDEY